MSQLMKRVAKKGFTLIELMIVVAIIGILAAIAIPKFADLITKSKESAIKGSLGSFRGALTIYYSDKEGWWPVHDATMTGLTAGKKYLDEVPKIAIPPQTTSGTNLGHPVTQTVANASAGNTGGWNYVATTGRVEVDCTEPDTKGTQWSLW
jgi:type IV pilus assembly protein PilA